MEEKRSFFQPWMVLLVMPLLGLVAMVLIIVADNQEDNPANRDQVAYTTPRAQTLPPRTPPPQPTSAVGLLAPDVTLTDLDGATFTLADYRGRVVIVNFWATWCTPCQAEMPALQAYNDSQAPDGPIVIAITDPDNGQTLEDIRTFVEAHDLTLRVGIDTDAVLHYAYRIYGLPTTYFIDANGITHHYRSGEMDVDDIIGEVASMSDS